MISWFIEHWPYVALVVSETAGVIAKGKYAGVVKTIITILSSILKRKEE